MADQELPEFWERENSKLFAFYSLSRNKKTPKFSIINFLYLIKLVKIYIFGKNNAETGERAKIKT
jgi:hypothetical protein